MSKITSKSVSNAQLDVFVAGRPIILWDAELRGFGVRIGPPNKRYPSGKTSYFVQKRVGGRGSKEIRFTFDAPDTSTARDKALILLARIRNGDSPAKERRDLLNQRRREFEEYKTKNFKDIFECYRKEKGDGSYYWEKGMQYYCSKYFTPALGFFPVTQITKDDIRAMLKAISSKSVAKSAEARLKPFFKWCVQEDIIARNPMLDLAPLPKEKSRERILSDLEIIAFWKATGDVISSNKPIMGYVFRLLLLTGQRLREIAHMESSEINFAEQIFTLPAARSKNDHAHLVHLTDFAFAILQSAPRKGNRFIFTYNGRKPIVGFSVAKRVLDRHMQKYLDEPIAPWQLRDLRRTFATKCAELGIDHNIADRILNHVSDSQAGVKGIYQKYQFLPERKQAMHIWNDHIQTLVNCSSDQEKQSEQH